MADNPPPASSSSTTAKAPAPKVFKPRAGIQRKTKAERDQFAKQEAERQQARLAEKGKTASPTAPATRGGKAGRGRGNATVNREDRTRGDGSGGGVFGAGSGVRPGVKPKGMLAHGVGYSEMLEGKEAGKVDENPIKTTGEMPVEQETGTTAAVVPKASARKAAGKPAEAVGVSSDDEPDEPKRDIERIWISSDEEDEENAISQMGKQKAPARSLRTGAGLRPVRAPRVHVEDDEESIISRKKAIKALRKSGDHDFYNIDSSEMDIDEVEVIKEPPSSPDLKKKPLRKPATKARDVRTATETVEERGERRRLNEDIQKLREEFSSIPNVKTLAGDGDDGATTDDGEQMENRLFLFQFPPLTPFLVDPNAPPGLTESKLESNSNTATSTNNVTLMTGTISAAPSIKADPDAPTTTTTTTSIAPASGLLTATTPYRLPSGVVGKLRMHKSGKVSLDWGGTDMEIRYGTEVDFLQDAVLVETPARSTPEEQIRNAGETDSPDNGNEGTNGSMSEEGMTYALGQIRKKMVVIPDWAQLYD